MAKNVKNDGLVRSKGKTKQKSPSGHRKRVKGPKAKQKTANAQLEQYRDQPFLLSAPEFLFHLPTVWEWHGVIRSKNTNDPATQDVVLMSLSRFQVYQKILSLKKAVGRAILTDKEVAMLLHTSEGALRKRRANGSENIPPYIKDGRRVIYDADDVFAYLDANKTSSS